MYKHAHAYTDIRLYAQTKDTHARWHHCAQREGVCERVWASEREIYMESKKLKLNWKTQGCNNNKNSNNNSKRSSWCGSEYVGREFSPIGICKAALVFVLHIDILQTSTLNARKTHTYEMQQQQQQISKTAQRGKYQKWKTTTKQQLQLESCDLMTFFVFVDHYGLHLHTYIASWVCCTHTHTHTHLPT